MPLPYQRTSYATWLGRAAAGTIQSCSTLTLGEFVRLCEYAEFEALWRTHPNRFQFDPNAPESDFTSRLAKACRYAYPHDLSRIRRSIRAGVAQVMARRHLLPAPPDAATDLQRMLDEWQTSAGDPPDAALVVAAKAAGVPNIASDDIDLITSAGVTVFTANGRAVDSARAAGKLL